MRLKNQGVSNYDFSFEEQIVGKDGKRIQKMKTFTVKAGEEIEIDEKHPLWKQMSKLPVEHAKDWLELAPPKLSKKELEAQLAAMKKQETQEAADKKKAEADAKAEAEAKAKEEADSKKDA